MGTMFVENAITPCKSSSYDIFIIHVDLVCIIPASPSKTMKNLSGRSFYGFCSFELVMTNRVSRN